MKDAIAIGLWALCLSAAGAEWTLESDGSKATFSERTGALLSLRGPDGVERVEPAAEMFTLSFLDDAGYETVLKSTDFALARADGRLTYRRAGGPEVEVAIRADRGTFAFRPRVSAWLKLSATNL